MLKDKVLDFCGAREIFREAVKYQAEGDCFVYVGKGNGKQEEGEGEVGLEGVIERVLAGEKECESYGVFQPEIDYKCEYKATLKGILAPILTNPKHPLYSEPNPQKHQLLILLDKLTNG